MSISTEAAALLRRAKPPGAQLKWCIAALSGCIALTVPLLLVQAPPLLDFLNHLARVAVLADGGADQTLARMYAAHWAIIPNLGLDVLLLPLLRMMPALDAGRIAAGVAMLLPVLGTIAYSRATYGRRSYWPLGACLVAYNATFLMGFLAFLMGIGLALLLAAAWIGGRDRRPVETALLGAAAMTGLFFCHLMGVVLALVLIGAFELDAIRQRPARAARRVALAAPLLIGPGILYLLSPLGAVSTPALRLPPGDKAFQLLVPFIGYDAVADLMTAAVVAVCLLGLIVSGRCRIRAHAAVAVGFLLILYAASPFIAKGTCFLDTRFAIMLGFMLFAAVMPVGVGRRAASAIALAFVAVFALRMATVGSAWIGYRHDLDAMRAVIVPVQPGERVFLVSVTPEEAPAYWRDAPAWRRLWTGVALDYHLAALVLLERHAFWPFLFADPAQQPIVTLEPYRTLAEAAPSVLPHRQMDAAATSRLGGYDYLLLLNAGGEPDLPGYGAGCLRLMRANDVAALYRVNQDDEACAGGRDVAVSEAAHP